MQYVYPKGCLNYDQPERPDSLYFFKNFKLKNKKEKEAADINNKRRETISDLWQTSPTIEFTNPSARGSKSILNNENQLHWDRKGRPDTVNEIDTYDRIFLCKKEKNSK